MNKMKQMVNLFKNGTLKHQTELTSRGFKIVPQFETIDRVMVKLPKDWQLRGSQLYHKGVLRALLNYEFNRTDWLTAYNVIIMTTKIYPAGHKFDYQIKAKIVGPKIIRDFKSESVNKKYYSIFEDNRLKEKAKKWLDKNLPDWRNPFAYWD